MRAIALLVVCVLVATVSMAAGETKEIKKDFDQTFQVSEGAFLELHCGDGDVTIVPWERDEVRVVVHYDATVNIGGAWKQTDFDVDFEHTGNIVRVVVHEPTATWGFGWVKRNIRKYVYEISAPAYTEIDVNGDDGDIMISGWRQDINCSLDDGDIKISDIECGRINVALDDGDTDLDGVKAAVSVSADDGDITIQNWTCPNVRMSLADGDIFLMNGIGDVYASLDDGDLTAREITAESFTASGEDGDMDIELATEGALEVEIATDDGDVDLWLNASVSAMLDVSMDDGDVSIAHDGLSGIEKRRHRFTGKLGDGDGSVRIRTADGDIVIMESK